MEAGSLDICLREERDSGPEFLVPGRVVLGSLPPHPQLLREVEPRVRSQAGGAGVSALLVQGEEEST